MRLVNITEDNFHEVIKIKLKDSQKIFVRDVVYSLAESYTYRDDRDALLFTLQNDDKIVGFVSLIKNQGEKTVYIWRMIINAEDQNNGYGSAALKVIEDYVRNLSIFEKVVADYVIGNDAMKCLLEKNNYIETGKQEEWNEIIMTKWLNDSSYKSK